MTAHVNLVQCGTLAEAISCIQKERFDVVLLDLSLPDSWGMMGVSKIYNVAPDLPIVVLTGLDDSAVEIRALLEGAQDYLIKGAISSDQVFRSIRYAIQRKKAEEALRQSEKWFHTLADLSPVGSFRTDSEGNCLYVSKSWCTMTGLTPEVAIGQRWTKPIHPEDRAKILADWYTTASSKNPYRNEFRFQRPDGRSIYVLGEATPVLNDQGAILGHIGTVTDITERKSAENLQSALYRIAEKTSSTEDLQEFYKAVSSIVGELMEASHFYIALYDEASETVTFPYFSDEDLRDQEPVKLGKGLIAHVLDTGKPLVTEHKDSQERLRKGENPLDLEEGDWLGVPLESGSKTFGVIAVKSYQPSVRFGEKEKKALAFVSRQIVSALERRRAYEELRKSEQKYRTLFEESRDVVFISTPEGRFLDINTAGLILFGYSSKKELLAVDITKDLFVHSEARPLYEQTMARDGFVKDFELVLKRKDGTRLVVLETSVAELDQQGKAVSYRGIMRDVTNVKELQQQLVQFQKMETIGRLAGGVAHDFNNILMAIMSYCDLSLSAVLDESIAKNLIEVKKQAETGAALTRQLLAFSRKQVLVPKVIDLNHVLTEMEPMIRRLLREDIAIVLNLDPNLGTIQADPYQIEQVVMNLVVNAKDAMPTGGRLTIQTTVEEFHHESQLEDVPISKGRYVKMAVTDTGLGMDDLTRLKIFEPFFTTKEVGKGSGLGLSSVYGIIKQSGGYIFVSSRPNSGSTFTIYLPELPAHLKQNLVEESPVATVQNVPAASQTILLVDDNAPVRSALGALLNLQGYNVFQASNGFEAMALCSDQSMRIDLLITDMVMPLIGGHELSEKLSLRYPLLKTLYMSGYAEDTVLREALSDHSSAFLQKPVSMKMFLEKIQALLA